MAWKVTAGAGRLGVAGLCLAVLLVAGGVGLAAQSEGSGLSAEQELQKRLEQHNKRLAAYMAAKKALEQLSEELDSRVPAYTEKVKENMLAQVESHLQPVESEALTQKLITGYVNELVQKRLATIAEKLELPQGVQPLLRKTQEQRQALLQGFLARHGQAIFGQARSQAAAHQLAQCKRRLFPSAKEVEELEFQDWSAVAVRGLKASLKNRMRAGQEAVLPEVEKRLDQAVEEVLQDVRDQQAAQLERLEDYQPDPSLVTRERLAEDYLEGLRLYLQEKRKSRPEDQSWRIIYDPLPSAKELARELAGQKEEQRFLAFLSQDVVQGADEATLRKWMAADPAAHKEPGSSLDLLVDKSLPAAKEQITTEYAAKAPAGLRKDFAARLQDIYLGEAEPKVREHLRAGLEPKALEARRELARQQLEEYFPSLARGTWALDGENQWLLDQAVRQEFALADYGSLLEPLDKKRPIQTITRKKVPHKRLLEETEALVVARARELLDEALRAWKGQRQLYDAFRGEFQESGSQFERRVLKEFDRLQEGQVKLQQVVDAWVERFHELWQPARRDVIWPDGDETFHADGSPKYTDVFQQVREDLAARLMARAAKVFSLEKQRRIKDKLAELSLGGGSGRADQPVALPAAPSPVVRSAGQAPRPVATPSLVADQAGRASELEPQAPPPQPEPQAEKPAAEPEKPEPAAAEKPEPAAAEEEGLPLWVWALIVLAAVGLAAFLAVRWMRARREPEYEPRDYPPLPEEQLEPLAHQGVSEVGAEVEPEPPGGGGEGGAGEWPQEEPEPPPATPPPGQWQELQDHWLPFLRREGDDYVYEFVGGEIVVRLTQAQPEVFYRRGLA